jgi:hypothetical protein
MTVSDDPTHHLVAWMVGHFLYRIRWHPRVCLALAHLVNSITMLFVGLGDKRRLGRIDFGFESFD